MLQPAAAQEMPDQGLSQMVIRGDVNCPIDMPTMAQWLTVHSISLDTQC